MKIEILEKIKHERDVFEEGDIRTVTDELGAYFCKAGWAKDVDGKVPTSERDIHHVMLAPDNVVHKVIGGEANG